MQQLKPEDLVRVAQQYLGTETQTVYALLPPDTAAKAPHIKTRSDEHPVETWQSAEGMRVLFKRDHRLPFVELRSVFLWGCSHRSALPQWDHSVDEPRFAQGNQQEDCSRTDGTNRIGRRKHRRLRR